MKFGSESARVARRRDVDSHITLIFGGKSVQDWQLIASAPFDRDIEVSVIEKGEVHALVISCRRTPNGWLNASTREPLLIEPTHWREWLR